MKVVREKTGAYISGEKKEHVSNGFFPANELRENIFLCKDKLENSFKRLKLKWILLTRIIQKQINWYHYLKNCECAKKSTEINFTCISKNQVSH